MQYKHVVCSVHCSMGSLKCTCSDLGTLAGAGVVPNIHCAVCRVQCAGCSVLPAKNFDSVVETGWVNLTFYLKK